MKITLFEQLDRIKSLSGIINENLNLAEKLYFSTGKIKPNDKEKILSITHGDNSTKLICDLFLEGYGDFNELKFFHEQIKTYDKNTFPIKGFDILNKNNIQSLSGILKKRAEIIKVFRELPSIAVRNLKHEIKIERDFKEFYGYEHLTTYFYGLYSMIGNRNEQMRKGIDKKMFKSGTTMSELVDFAAEKENLLGGIKVTKKVIKDAINNDYSHELELIYETPSVMVVDVTGPNGIKAIGCQSLWCFTYGSGFDNAYRQWNNYSTNDHVYVIIDFTVPSDDSGFMYVLIKPLGEEIPERDDDDDEPTPLFNMANDNIYYPYAVIDELIGREKALALFTFNDYDGDYLSEGYEDDLEHQAELDKTGFWGKAGAGAIILAKNTGRILLPLRSKYVLSPGTWGTWGGAIDKGKSPEEAVKQEVYEECGYDGEFSLHPLYVFEDAKSGFKYYNFLAVVEEEFTPELNWETADFKWVNLNELPNNLHNGLKSLLSDQNSLNLIKNFIKQK